LDNLPSGLRAVANQGGGRFGLNCVKFVVDGSYRNRDLFIRSLIGGVHRLVGSAHHLNHQFEYRREQQIPRVLALGNLFKQLIHFVRSEDSLKDATSHHRNRALLHKRVKDLAKHRGYLLVAHSAASMLPIS